MILCVAGTHSASVTSRDQRGGESAVDDPKDSELERLRKEVEELKVVLGRASARIQKLGAELDTAQAQVAWFHRQVFGQKAEHGRFEELEAAWHAYLKEQEAKVRGVPPTDVRSTADLSSVQLLLGFF